MSPESTRKYSKPYKRWTPAHDDKTYVHTSRNQTSPIETLNDKVKSSGESRIPSKQVDF